MAVYVDDMNLRADVPDGAKVVRGRWSHLFADTEDELRAFATKIGLNQDWIQHPGEPHVHFDVTGRMRQRAMAAGATPLTWRQAGEFFAQRTQQGLTGTPAAHWEQRRQQKPSDGGPTPGIPSGGHDRTAVRRAELPGWASWTWRGTTGLVLHNVRIARPGGTAWWTIWAGDIPNWPGQQFSCTKREEVERQVERLRATEADKLAANRFLRSLGYTATEHAPTRPDCNCHDCQPPPSAPAPAGPADDGTGQARGREPEEEPGPAAEGRSADTAAGRALRQAAHFYLGHGLLPVPAWAARADGSCRCPRGGHCPRPGKHPRSVHVGPGERDYSWKPLACRTHAEVERRFADGGRYAGANLMLAIPPGMLVVDQDDDDGGPQAIATLAAQLGDLPATLGHRTPHGVHRIYRTPPGWTGRAWVGKDARNPLPPGVDLRVPGQILMAAPSRVPDPGGLAAYGPTIGAAVADLPAAYLAAWTPPQALAARPRRPIPVSAERSDTAERYVHRKITGILADLAGADTARNTALYTAALKIGSALGAARTTPGAQHAAAGWSDQAAEDALLDAAETNGYLAKDGPAAARTAIRSGLRNGLRHPRPLPAFTAQPTTPPPAAHHARRQEPGGEARAHRHAQAAPAARSQDARPQAKAAQPEDTRPVLSIVPGYTRFARDQPAGEEVTPHRAAATRNLPTTAPTRSASTPAPGSQAAPAAGTSAGRGHTGRTRSTGRAPAGAAAPRQDAGTGARPAAPLAPQAPSRQAPDASGVSGVLRAAGFVASSEALQAVHTPEGYQVQATAEGHILIRHVAIGEPVLGISPPARTEQMLAIYAQALRAAGFHVTSHARGSLIVGPETARQPTPGRAPAGQAAGRQAPVSPAPVPDDAYRTPDHVAAGNARPRRPARRPARERAGEPETGAPATSTRAEPQPPGPDGAPAPPPAGGGEQQAHRSGETSQGITDGRATTVGQVPGRGAALPQSTGGSPKQQHRPAGTGRPAGAAFGSGDLDRGSQLLAGTPGPDRIRPQRPQEHDEQTSEHPAQGPAQPVAQGTEKAPCPQCGKPHIRATGETYPCLSCETQARLKAAGFTPGSREIKRVTEWNRPILDRSLREPEMLQAPLKPETQTGQETNPPVMTRPAPAPARVKDLDHEREASG